MLPALAMILCQTQASPLDMEPKLVRPLTVAAHAETIEDLLARISRETGVRLEAAPPVKDDLIALFAKDTPVKETLGMIATHFSWTWEKTKDGFRLFRTAKQQSEEERAARESLVSVFRKWQNDSVEALRVATTPRDQQDYNEAMRESQDLHDRYEAEYFAKDQAVRNKWVKESGANEEKRTKLGRRMSPVWRLHDTIVASLSENDFLALDRSTKLVFSYSPTSWQRPLPGSANALAAEVVKFLSASSQIRGGGSADRLYKERDFLSSTMKCFQPEDVATIRATYKREFGVDPSMGVFNPAVKIVVLGKSGEMLSQAFVDTRTRRPQPSQREAPPKNELDEPIVKSAELEELNTGSSNRLVSLKASADALQEFLKMDSRVHPAKGLARLLAKTAEDAKFSFISDIYDRPGWLNAGTLQLATARTAFANAAARTWSSWSFDGRWIKMRANHWAYTRESSASAATLRWIRNRLLSQPDGFDAIADAATKLTDKQFGGTLVNYLLVRHAAWTLHDRDQRSLCLLRFWGSTPRAMRDALLKGQTVSYSSLSRDQQDHLAQFVYRQDDKSYDTDIYSLTSHNALEEDEVNWMSKNWPGWNDSRSYETDWESTQRFPAGIPGDALISVRRSNGNALIVSNGKGWTGAMSEQMAVFGGYYKPDSEYLAVPTTEDRMVFTIAASPTLVMGYKFGSIRPKDGEPKSYSELPEEIRTRLEKAYRARRGGGGG